MLCIHPRGNADTSEAQECTEDRRREVVVGKEKFNSVKIKSGVLFDTKLRISKELSSEMTYCE
jgi:hypothetical protein